MGQPIFDYNETTATSTCFLEFEGQIFIGTAQAHPDDMDMASKLVGQDIAYRRAMIKYLSFVRDWQIKTELRALKQLYYLLKRFPEDSRLHYNTGLVLENLKKFDSAIIAYQNALDISPDEPDFLYNLGYAYLQSGEFDKAIPFFKRVLQLEQDDSNSYFNLGYLYSKKQEHALSIT
jgi:tetratricopeptide (TPR) repeat protein